MLQALTECDQAVAKGNAQAICTFMECSRFKSVNELAKCGAKYVIRIEKDKGGDRFGLAAQEALSLPFESIKEAREGGKPVTSGRMAIKRKSTAIKHSAEVVSLNQLVCQTILSQPS